MTTRSIFRNLYADIRRLTIASSANVTTMFALSLLPIAGAVGAAVDYSQGSSIQAAMQAAADAASLGTIKSASTLTPDLLKSTATGIFNATFNRPQVSPSVNATYDSASNTVTVSASASFVQAEHIERGRHYDDVDVSHIEGDNRSQDVASLCDGHLTHR